MVELLDRVRQFWDRQPCNIRHSAKPVGSREYFDEVETRAGADPSVVELSERSLQLCRQRFEIYGLQAKFYLGNAEELISYVPVGPTSKRKPAAPSPMTQL